tara:strand:+ start:260 stop:637 length:378 start_codon:yes stop_codon:yes gene_type:complete
MFNPAALFFSLFSIVADSVRPVRVKGATVGYRVAIGRARLHVDATEVSVWMTGAGACLVTLYRAPAPRVDWTAAPVPSPGAFAASFPTICGARRMDRAPVAPVRRYRPVWRISPRPSSVRLAGVA